MKTTRRDFLKVGAIMAGVASGVSAAGEALFSPTASAGQAVPPTARKGDMIYRKLGHTGAQVSAIGVGGHHLGDFASVDDAIRLVHEAVDAGVTFFDNCWEYYNGRTENILGRGLKGRRDKVFLMTKVCTHGRSGRLALQMLEESLRRLQTDHLDLWQIHGIVYDNDPELAYVKGGVLEAFDQAKKQGKTRFVGFTGHKEPAFHLKMLELGYPFDTVQMPLNPFDACFHSFQNQVLPEVNRRGMGALGMKSMGGTAWAIRNGVVKAEEMLRYAMSLPVATTICGMESLDVLHQNLSVVRDFQPMTESEMEALRARCAPTAADGRFEPYKVSLRYDNPMTRLPHGFPFDHTQREVTEMLEKGDAPWLVPQTMPPA
jgi:aryl-alcohol dehydrogenase-like predicted oxidoreductase